MINRLRCRALLTVTLLTTGGQAYAQVALPPVPATDIVTSQVVPFKVDVSACSIANQPVFDQCLAQASQTMAAQLNAQGANGFHLVSLVPVGLGSYAFFALYQKVDPQRSAAVLARTDAVQQRLDSVEKEVSTARADLLAVLRGSLQDVFAAHAIKDLGDQIQRTLMADFEQRIDTRYAELQKQITSVRAGQAH